MILHRFTVAIPQRKTFYRAIVKVALRNGGRGRERGFIHREPVILRRN